MLPSSIWSIRDWLVLDCDIHKGYLICQHVFPLSCLRFCINEVKRVVILKMELIDLFTKNRTEGKKEQVKR